MNQKLILIPIILVLAVSFVSFDDVLNSGGFEKPSLLSRIQGDIATNVHVYWLLNTNSNQITQIISDENGNILSSSLENLQYKTMSSIRAQAAAV